MPTYCDICDRLVDLEEDHGAYDDEAGIYSCGPCQDEWQYTVTGVRPSSQPLSTQEKSK